FMPGIHDFYAQDVDGRAKPGHDVWRGGAKNSAACGNRFMDCRAMPGHDVLRGGAKNSSCAGQPACAGMSGI
ncbi:MAG: hypothetical protein WBL98_11615, partial [Pseudolabrys sp.]